MAAGKISIQANDGKVAGVVFEDGASSNVTVTVPKEGGVVATEAYADTKVSKTGNETIAGVKTFSDSVGIGVTPMNSGSTTHGIQTEYNYMGSQGGSGQIMYNAVPYSNTSSKYLYSSMPVVAYEQNTAGQHLWKIAPSGTAGNPITWTNAMTLGANGNLLIGTTTDNGIDKLQVNGSISSGIVRDVSDLNTITSAGGFLTGDFTFSIAANRPCSYGTLHQIARSQTECTQMVQDILSDNLFVRRYVNSAWTAWVTK